MSAPQLSQELGEIRYASTATVNLAYRREDFPTPLDGYGFVVPTLARRKIMACTFSSMKYAGRAPEGYVLLRAFVGGVLQPELFEQDNDSMEQNVRRELSELLDVQARPLFCRIYRHPSSMPQYAVGHRGRVQRIQAHVEQLRGLSLAGNAYEGIGIADCIHSGEKAAEKIWAELGNAKRESILD
jgi:oxygen-dependent protoporphyrinogen oxidase